MRSQKKYVRLSSFLAMQKHSQIQIDTKNEFIFRPTVFLPASCSKLGRQTKEKRHYTKETSPINKTSHLPSMLPQVQVSKSSMRLNNQKEGKEMCSKTVQFLDSLINILKEDDITSMTLDSKKRIATEIPISTIKKPSKKPKIVQNGLTKMFFQPPKGPNRNIYSEECSRKLKTTDDQMEDFTFYGNLKKKMEISSTSQMKFSKEIKSLKVNLKE